MTIADKVRFGDIANVTDYVANGSFAALKDNVSYEDKPSYAVLVRLADYNSGWSGPFVYVDKMAFQFLKKTELLPGDVIISNVGANAGTVFTAPDLGIPMTLGPNSVVLKGLEVPRYWYYFFSGAVGQHELGGITSGSAQPKFNKTDLRNLLVPKPSLNEQREIAAILGALDDKIELNRKTASTLEEMARTLYRSWFVDFDPVWAKVEGRPPAHMDAATAALFPDSFGDDGLPVGWEMKRLGDLITLNYGKALKKELREEGPYPVYGSGGSDSYHREPLVDVPTIVVGRKGTVGSLFWEPRGCWPIDTVFYVSSGLPMPYVYRTLQILPLSEMNTDAAVPGLNRDNAYRLEVVLPDESTLTAFTELAGAWQGRIDSFSAQSQSLASLRNTLLPKLMSGELRVGEAREMVEEVA
jgi:type I restriction enzyme S subunit